MAVLFITCGMPGAGKTTVARRLEQEHHALRLTPDDSLRELFGGGLITKLALRVRRAAG